MKPLGLILAGGQSKRLFPIEIAKPLLKVDGKSLLQQAIDRLKGFDVRVICNHAISRQVEEAFARDEVPLPGFAIEPEGRDTAAAVGFGLKSAGNSSWVAVISADQWLKEPAKFSSFLKTVEEEIKAHPDSLFVAGSLQSTKDKKAHSQFGWIVPKKEKNRKSWEVEVFVEKPKGAKLTKVRAQGGLINAGMFFGRHEVFMSAYQKFYPKVLDSSFPYASLERQPIDRAIFEKFDKVRVLPFPLIWEDLGTWKDWFHLVGKGQGNGGVKVHSKNVLISSDDEFTIYSFDNEDLAIVQSGKKILVMPLSKSKELKDYLEKI